MENKGVFQLEIIINVLSYPVAISASLEYLGYYSTAIINVLILLHVSVRGSTLDVRI